MKRPLLLSALAVLAGTALGIREVPQAMKAAAILMMAAVCLWGLRGTGEEKSEGPAPDKAYLSAIVLLAVLFLGSFFRAFRVSASFHMPEAEAFFERFEATNPGQFDYAMYLKGQGVASQAELDCLQAADEDVPPEEEDRQPAAPFHLLLHWTAQFRMLSENALDLALTPQDSGIMKAVLLGQKSSLDEEIRNLYQASGIAHLLAVSGLHVSMLGMGLYGILRKGKWSRTAAGAAAGLMAVWYLVMIGLPGSSARAGIMLLLIFAAGAAGRYYDMQSALSAALILMIWHRPYRIFQSGFQLSFAAVSSIAFVSGNLIHAMEKMAAERTVNGTVKRIGSMFRLPGWQTALITGACIQLVTLPVIAWHYFVFPVYGCILNLAVIPLMGLVLASGMAVLGVLIGGAFARAPVSGSFLIRPGMISAAAAAPGHYILCVYEKLCTFSLRLPFSTVLIGRPSLWQILVYYLVLGNAARILSCGSRRPIRSRQRIFLLWSVLILNAFILKPVRLPGVKVTAIDVGQGDGFLIEKGRHAFLIDCGSSSNRSLGSRVLEPLLLSKGIEKIDAAIVSHGDTDHISGLMYLMEEEERIRVSSLILPGPALGNDKYEALIKAFNSQKNSAVNKTLIYHKENSEDNIIKYLSEGDMILDDHGIRLICLYAGNGIEKENANRHSTALLLESGNFRMLFTGDMEAADEPALGSNWERLCPGKTLTVLKTAHHGSATSSSETLIRKLRPKYAVISAGKNNRYGHPSPEVTKRLEDHGAVLLQTAEHGAVEICVFKNHVRIFGFRNG